MLKNQNTRRLIALGMASLMVLSSAFVSDVKADAKSNKEDRYSCQRKISYFEGKRFTFQSQKVCFL